jgi:ATP-dependent Clp protease ATP-binding subunit ClpA
MVIYFQTEIFCLPASKYRISIWNNFMADKADIEAYKDKFSESGRRILETALDESRKRDQNYITTEHILHALAYEEAELFNATMHDLAVDPRSVKLLIESGSTMADNTQAKVSKLLLKPPTFLKSRWTERVRKVVA